MSTRASTDVTTDRTENTTLVYTFDLHGEDFADLTMYTANDITGPTMGVELYREDVQRLIELLTANLHRVPERNPS